MHNSIVYTPATAADTDVLVQHRLDFLQIVSGQQPEASIAQVRISLQSYFPAAIKEGNFHGIIAKIAGSVAGTGGMIVYSRPANYNSRRGKVGYILNMYTLPAYRRLGIGSSILQMLTEKARELGIDILELHASQDGEPIYQAAGFIPHTAVNMVKKLD